MTKARIVGSREELGLISEDGLNFYGHAIHREWTELHDPKPEALEKLRGNRHVELSGDKAPKAAAEAPAKADAPAEAADDEETAVRAELAELGVEAKPDASLRMLKMALGKARKAHAGGSQD